MRSKARTVREYLASLPEDRREAIGAVRDVIRKNLPKGYAEGMAYGMIGYHVPHSIYPDGYHCNPEQPLPFASLASQKNHMALYLMCVYSDPELEAWFRDAWKKTGKKLDMGKSCIRFKKLEDVPLEVIGQVIRKVPVKKFIEFYEAATGRHGTSARKTSTPGSRKTATKVARGRAMKPSSRTSKKPASKVAAGSKSATKSSRRPAAKTARRAGGTTAEKTAAGKAGGKAATKTAAGKAGGRAATKTAARKPGGRAAKSPAGGKG